MASISIVIIFLRRLQTASIISCKVHCLPSETIECEGSKFLLFSRYRRKRKKFYGRTHVTYCLFHRGKESEKKALVPKLTHHKVLNLKEITKKASIVSR